MDDSKKCSLKNILIVEDNETDVFISRKILERSFPGTQITVTSCGNDALQYLHSVTQKNPEQIPDLILLDLFMPVMDGVEFLAKIKESGIGTTKIVVLSVLENHPLIEQVRADKNVSLVLQKPFLTDQAELLNVCCGKN